MCIATLSNNNITQRIFFHEEDNFPMCKLTFVYSLQTFATATEVNHKYETLKCQSFALIFSSEFHG